MEEEKEKQSMGCGKGLITFIALGVVGIFAHSLLQGALNGVHGVLSGIPWWGMIIIVFSCFFVYITFFEK